MLAVINAINHISSLTPAPLPKVTLPQVPDINPAAELAQITGGSPLNLQVQARKLLDDIEGMDQIEAQAHTLVHNCIHDLVTIGVEALIQAVPVALGLLIPNPATRVAAKALLREIAKEAVQRAISRIAQLVAQLAQLAVPLLAIAAKKATATVIDSTLHAHPAAAQLAQSALNSSAPPAAELPPASSAIPPTASSYSLDPAASVAAGKAAANAALSQIGTPYAWGGSSSQAFDCSGLTQWAYRQAGIELPRLAHEQAVGTQVTASELLPGDLAVWDGHVAMYAGDGQIVEAGNPVQVNPLRTNNMGMTFKGFWRPTQ